MPSVFLLVYWYALVQTRYMVSAPSWLDAHDAGVGFVEAQGRGGEAVGHQVDPQQLHWVERLGQTCAQVSLAKDSMAWVY